MPFWTISVSWNPAEGGYKDGIPLPQFQVPLSWPLGGGSQPRSLPLNRSSRTSKQACFLERLRVSQPTIYAVPGGWHVTVPGTQEFNVPTSGVKTIRCVPWAAAAETKAPKNFHECSPMRTADAVELAVGEWENGAQQCIFSKSKLKQEPTGFSKIQNDDCPRSRSAGVALWQEVQDFSNSASEHALGHFVYQPFPSSLQHFWSCGHKPCWFSEPGVWRLVLRFRS